MHASQSNGGTAVRPTARDDDAETHESAGRSATVTPILLTEREAAAVFGISHRAFQTLAGESFMPRAIVLGPRSLRWSVDELRAAVAAMPRQTQRTQPASLLRAKVERLKATGTAS